MVGGEVGEIARHTSRGVSGTEWRKTWGWGRGEACHGVLMGHCLCCTRFVGEIVDGCGLGAWCVVGGKCCVTELNVRSTMVQVEHRKDIYISLQNTTRSLNPSSRLSTCKVNVTYAISILHLLYPRTAPHLPLFQTQPHIYPFQSINSNISSTLTSTPCGVPHPLSPLLTPQSIGHNPTSQAEMLTRGLMWSGVHDMPSPRKSMSMSTTPLNQPPKKQPSKKPKTPQTPAEHPRDFLTKKAWTLLGRCLTVRFRSYAPHAGEMGKCLCVLVQLLCGVCGMLEWEG
ncbi:hypothetical protein BU24DRAFT_217910 [Aaosphaeria arxii CBS 175.79]|uniref:Uncharacterized protein n=1 Tax=Aaosphaeria arxii CBS 175.79 TaxID=1450172 RepID=A0A6A5XNZ8_9PLEO|nr:uncharacterized protein BU24DRAFT_217910 [Aaosphaeria arxii CBS 175.79]KAF2014629.1 hypothetical protein BU24DRAFT_217910 [Aaosphaeria arxii CBS 175.79]